MLPNLAEGIYRTGTLTALLLPSFWTLGFRALAARSAPTEQTRTWLVYRRRIQVLMLLAVPVWWSLFDACLVSRLERTAATIWPVWILFTLPLCAGAFLARLLMSRSDRKLLDCKWKASDMMRLAFWGTVASTLPLLLVANGMDSIRNGRWTGVLWTPIAGVLALAGTVCQQRAAGIKLRTVKSGEVYKRALILSKRIHVHLDSICVVPYGRGHLTNAFGGFSTVAITDDYGHWLSGAELDFVIGHELGHVKKKHTLKKLPVLAGTYALAAAASFALPPLSMPARVVFDFEAILLPLWVFYFVSRRCEYEADRMGVEIAGDGEMAIRALENLDRRTELPTSGNAMERLFLTHPLLQQRIKAIRRLEERSTQCTATRAEPQRR